MAAGIEEPSGKAAGRVTITGLAAGLIPPFFTVLVVIGLGLLGFISAEIAGAVALGVLANAGLTSSTVFAVQKKTPTDQARLIWGSAPVADVVTPPAAPVAEPERLAEDDAPVRTGAHRADVSLADELEQYRPAGGVS